MEIERGMSFSSRTMMGRDEVGKIQQVLQSLNSSFDSVPFREPVNWQQIGILDYPVIIKTPMDLGSVKKKVQTNRYEYVEDCLDDINLIWANAKLYNPKENDIHKLADKLQKQTKKMIKNYLPFVKIDMQAGKKKKQTKKQTKAPVKPPQKNQQPRTYLQKQQQAKIENGNGENPESEEPQHILKRKNLLYLMQLCNKDQVGVIFLLIKSHNPQVIDFDQDGSVNIHGQKLEDRMVTRLNQLMQLWGISMKNVIITTNTNNNKKK